MKKLLLLSTLLIFACSSEDSNDGIEINLIELIKGKVYHKEIPNGVRYVHFDLSYLGEDLISERYEGWTYYEKHNNDPNQLGCFLDYSISSIDYGLYLRWYTDTIINNPQQFKLDGIYNQTWIVTKDDNDIISIKTGGDGSIDDGYTEISSEEFMQLDCL